jgi:hypothetical protein
VQHKRGRPANATMRDTIAPPWGSTYPGTDDEGSPTAAASLLCLNLQPHHHTSSHEFARIDWRSSNVTVLDQFRHVIATAFNPKGRGLVVLTSCSHRGVVNAVKQVQATSGVGKVHAVIGGFHLAPYKEDYVRDTVSSLKEIDVDYIVPPQCTGEPFSEIAKAEMPRKVQEGLMAAEPAAKAG